MTVVEACAVAFLQFVGHPPMRGELVTVPKSVEQRYSFAQRTKAKSCAVLLGVKWRIAKDQ